MKKRYELVIVFWDTNIYNEDGIKLYDIVDEIDSLAASSIKGIFGPHKKSFEFSFLFNNKKKAIMAARKISKSIPAGKPSIGIRIEDLVENQEIDWVF